MPEACELLARKLEKERECARVRKRLGCGDEHDDDDDAAGDDG